MKILFNLPASDIKYLWKIYGKGKVNEAIKKLVQNHVQTIKHNIAEAKVPDDE